MKLFVSFLLFLVVLSSCKKNEIDPNLIALEFHLAEIDSAEGLVEYDFGDGMEKFYLHQEILSDNSDIADASVEEMNNEFVVLVDFTEEGKSKWSRITGENIGKNIAILVDKKLVTAPIIRARIDQGKAIINGGFTKEEAERIAEGIKRK